MRGRKPKATVLKLLDGNPGKRPINTREPKPSPLSADCPVSLVHPVAQQEWKDRIVPAIRIGQITSADYSIALAHCELYADWRDCWAEAEKHERIIMVGTQPQPNPYRSEARKVRAELWKIDAEIGFTPVSRSRVIADLPDVAVESKWAGILK